MFRDLNEQLRTKELVLRAATRCIRPGRSIAVGGSGPGRSDAIALAKRWETRERRPGRLAATSANAAIVKNCERRLAPLDWSGANFLPNTHSARP